MSVVHTVVVCGCTAVVQKALILRAPSAQPLNAAAALPLACILLTVERLFTALHMIGSSLLNFLHGVARLIDVLLAVLTNHTIGSFWDLVGSQHPERR